MYNKHRINELTLKYADTGEEETFSLLLNELVFMVEAQLKKKYWSVRDFWDDLKQDALMYLWEHRNSYRNMRERPSEKPDQFFYFLIRGVLHRLMDKYKDKYDCFNKSSDYFDDLNPSEKAKLGITSEEE